MEIKTNNNIVYSCKYHVVWCPKYRRKVLVGAVEQRLKELLQEVCDSRKAEIIELEIMPDHVHLLAEVDPQFGIHRLIKEIKGTTSRILRQEFKHQSKDDRNDWQNQPHPAPPLSCPNTSPQSDQPCSSLQPDHER